MSRTWASWLTMAALIGAAACGSARRSTPIVGPRTFAPTAERGQVVFMRKCHQCHPQGEAGLGPALNDKPLPAFLMRFQVRRGLGAMPAFGKDEISDEQLDELVQYLKELRRGPAASGHGSSDGHPAGGPSLRSHILVHSQARMPAMRQ